MADGEDSIFHLWKEYFQEELSSPPTTKIQSCMIDSVSVFPVFKNKIR
jgi:hypothetical protein